MSEFTPCDWGEFGQIGITYLIKSEKSEKLAQFDSAPNFNRPKFSFRFPENLGSMSMSRKEVTEVLSRVGQKILYMSHITNPKLHKRPEFGR